MIVKVASMLGLGALFVAILVGLYAAFGAFGAKATREEADISLGLDAPSGTPKQQGEGPETATSGETVTAGDAAWTVTDAYPETELHTYTVPPETVPGSYVSLEFVVENLSDEPVTLTPETITLFDAVGNEYRPEPDRNNAYVKPEKNLLFNEYGLLEPGQSKEGKVNFEVLPDASGFVALLGDTDPTANEGEYVDLGF